MATSDSARDPCDLQDTTNETAVTELWATYQRLAAEYNSQPDEAPDDSPLWDSWMEVSDAIAAARPTDLAGIAAQVRWLAEQARIGHRGDEPELLDDVAARLGALAC